MDIDILALPMKPNDAEAATVRDYLKALLSELIEKEDGFSGKRPFGNSGWKYDLYTPLIEGGAVSGSLDGDGYVQEIDSDKADALILGAIEKL